MPRVLLLACLLLCGWTAGAQSSANVQLLCNWRDTSGAPMNGAGQHWNDVWGFSWNGKEYAVIGGTAGAHVIDVDDCTERAFLPGRSRNVVHRDYKTFGHYLYAVADEGISTLQVFDYSYLPDSPRLVWESDPAYLANAHNIFIDTAKAKLYCASAYSLGSGHDDIQVYSLADPEKPELIRTINEYDNTHDVYVRNDTAWCSNGFAGYLALDLRSSPNKIIGGLINYPFKGFNHSSWLGYDYIGVIADESFGMPLKVIDASDPAQIEVLSSFGPRGADTTSVPHNPYLLGRYVFVSYYMDGLQIYDLGDPRNPVQTGYYDTYPQPESQRFAGAWGVFPYLPSRRILVSDMQTGLYVFNADLAMPKLDAGPTPRRQPARIYPNPAVDKLFLQLPNGMGGRLSLRIYSMTGMTLQKLERDMSSGSNPPLEVSLPADMAPGMYLLQATIAGQSFTARFTKK